MHFDKAHCAASLNFLGLTTGTAQRIDAKIANEDRYIVTVETHREFKDGQLVVFYQDTYKIPVGTELTDFDEEELETYRVSSGLKETIENPYAIKRDGVK